MTRCCVLLWVAVLAVACAVSAHTWYIAQDGTGDAPTIGAGIDSASTGDTVLVACGTYYEALGVKEGVTLLSEDGNADCVTIDGQYTYRGLGCGPCDSLTVIKGFTIARAVDYNLPSGSGGGLLCVRSDSLVIENCAFVSNGAEWGGGVSLEYCSPTFINCTFADNGYASQGGALWLGVSSPVLENCTFVGNSALYGGAVCCEMQSAPLFKNCIFYRNHGHYFGGGIYCNQFATPTLENTVIAYSEARAAIWCEDEWSAPTLTCCDIYGNTGGDWTECIAEQQGTHGNLSAAPRFCDAPSGDFTLEDCSPCLPGNHPGY